MIQNAFVRTKNYQLYIIQLFPTPSVKTVTTFETFETQY